MKAGWKTVKLGDVAEITSGLWKGEMGELIEAKVYRATNFFGNGELSDEDLVTIPVEVKKLTKRTLEQGDILLEKSGGGPNQPVGRVGLFRKSDPLHSFSNFTSRIRVIKGSDLDQAFLHKYLHWVHLSGGTAGMQNNSTNIRNLDLDKYRSIEIPLPPLAEQKRIVALLDEAFAGIDEAMASVETNSKTLGDLSRSHTTAIFTQRGQGWSEKRLVDISTNLDSKRVPITKSDRSIGKYPYYGASGVVDYVEDYIFEGDNLLISEDGANLLARSTPIAFSVSGKYWVNNHAHILHFQNIATQRFVEHYLESIKLDQYITGAAQPKLNQKALNSIPIPIPDSLDMQAKVVASIDRIQSETGRLRNLYKEKVDTLAELKRSLLSQAFAGELTA